MAEQLAIDYAWQHPAPAAIVQAGYSAVIRYLSADPTKDLTADEASQLHEHGLGVGLIWETTAQRAMGSTVAGLADGSATASALAQLSVPIGTPVWVNAGDWSVQPSDLGAILAYYQAWRQNIGAYNACCGGYGPSIVIRELAIAFPDDAHWQNAISAIGYPGDVVNAGASLYQRVSPTHDVLGYEGDYDEDVYGFGPRAQLNWWTSAAPQPVPTPPAGADMPLPPTIRQGDSGPAVRTAQGLLVARYYRLGTTGPAGDGIDGAFGPLTDAAVREAQGAARIAVDGIVGPQTWPVLLGV